MLHKTDMELNDYFEKSLLIFHISHAEFERVFHLGIYLENLL